VVIKLGREPDLGKRIRTRQGAKIREVRKIRQMSTASLAEKIGVTEGAIIHWETGRYSPKQVHQVAVARALDVPWSVLFSIDGEAA